MHTKNIGIVQKTVGILEFKKWVFRFWDFMGGIFFLSLFLFVFSHHHSQFQNIFVTPKRNAGPISSHFASFPNILSSWQPLIYFVS